MKKRETILGLMSILSLALVAAPGAHADDAPYPAGTLYCHSLGADSAGLTLAVAPDTITADLFRNDIQGRTKIADFDCRLPPNVPGPTPPEGPYRQTLVCSQLNANEDAMIVRAYVNTSGGPEIASVRHRQIVRGQAIETELDFGRLKCRTL